MLVCTSVQAHHACQVLLWCRRSIGTPIGIPNCCMPIASAHNESKVLPLSLLTHGNKRCYQTNTSVLSQFSGNDSLTDPAAAADLPVVYAMVTSLTP